MCLSKIEEKRRKQSYDDDNRGLDINPALGRWGVPGLCPGSDLRGPTETLEQVLQFQRNQIEEKKVKLHQMTQSKNTQMLFLIIYLEKPVRTCLMSVLCSSVEDWIREQARGGATRSCSPGLCSLSSAIREEAGETEQADESTRGEHQPPTGRTTQTTVSNI